MRGIRAAGLAVFAIVVVGFLARPASGAGLTVTPDRNPAAAGVPVVFKIVPAVTATNDTVSFTFGDGGSATLAYSTSCALFGGCDSISHAYAGAGVFQVAASGTIGGQSVSGGTEVSVTAAAADDEIYVPACAHVDGFNQSRWRTDLELHNPGSTEARFQVLLLEFGKDNLQARSVDVTLPPDYSVSRVDALVDLFNFTGTAALRVVPITGSVMIGGRTYNDQPTGTYGQALVGTRRAEAIAAGERGRLIGLFHEPTLTSGYRTAVGLVNASPADVSVEVKLYNRFGVLLGTVTVPLKAYEFRQVERVFEQVFSQAVDGGYAVVRPLTAASKVFAYASVVDNLTGDPTYVAARVER